MTLTKLDKSNIANIVTPPTLLPQAKKALNVELRKPQ
jgi:hypothetical protein